MTNVDYYNTIMYILYLIRFNNELSVAVNRHMKHFNNILE